jgi:hypothetical protein
MKHQIDACDSQVTMILSISDLSMVLPTLTFIVMQRAYRENDGLSCLYPCDASISHRKYQDEIYEGWKSALIGNSLPTVMLVARCSRSDRQELSPPEGVPGHFCHLKCCLVLAHSPQHLALLHISFN